MTTYRGTLTGDDGSTLDVTATTRPPTPPVPPDVTPVVVLAGGSAFHTIDGVNTSRGDGQLVLYRSPVLATETNRWGTEVAVLATGVVTAVYPREAADTGPTPIPSGGYVLSGHAAAGTWLKDHAPVGAVLTLGTVPVPPTPAPTGGYPEREIAGYHMMWGSNGPDLDTVHPAFNVIRLAFASGSGPTMVGWSSAGLATFRAKALAMRARGVRFVVSLGGGGESLDPSNPPAFVDGLAGIKLQLSFLDGIDWDWESGWNTSQVVAVSKAAVARFGTGFAVTFAPGGGSVANYLAAAVECQRSGILTSYGQQFYDAPVSVLAAAGRISEAVAAGIPISKISVGMMIAPDGSHWSNAQCKANFTALRAQFPGLQRAYLWELQRAGTAQWAADMAAILGV